MIIAHSITVVLSFDKSATPRWRSQGLEIDVQATGDTLQEVKDNTVRAFLNQANPPIPAPPEVWIQNYYNPSIELIHVGSEYLDSQDMRTIGKSLEVEAFNFKLKL